MSSSKPRKEHKRTKPPKGAEVIQLVRNRLCPRNLGQHQVYVAPSRTLLVRSVCDRHGIAEVFGNSEELSLVVHVVHEGHRSL